MESSDACQLVMAKVRLINCEAVAARHYHASKTQHLILTQLIIILLRK